MKHLQRILSAVLTLALMFSMLPAQAAAVVPESEVLSEKPSALITGEGETIEIDESWDAKYPYGAFAFGVNDVSMAEGGDSLSISVFRLGGTTGRATVQIVFNPLVMPKDDEGNLGSSSAAGLDDLLIEVEDPLPIAAYQPVGKDADPDPGQAHYAVVDYTGEDALEGDKVLILHADAASYQWFFYTQDAWHKLEGATDNNIVLSADELEEYDFRCIYTVGGQRLCSDSYHGVSYVKPEPEILEAAPEDIELFPEPTYTQLYQEEEDPSAPVAFTMTFADGEWAKEIRLTPLEDNIAEPMKFATFTMIANLGGDIFNEAGTFILSLEDNDAPESFTLRFEDVASEADKADGVARVAVVRAGGNQVPVSVSYATRDGSAVAGVDYEAVSGELSFYAEYVKNLEAVS